MWKLYRREQTHKFHLGMIKMQGTPDGSHQACQNVSLFSLRFECDKTYKGVGQGVILVMMVGLKVVNSF